MTRSLTLAAATIAATALCVTRADAQDTNQVNR